ncbi:hypothetical protein PUN28_016699 [Cardiocondyla obscurior]|uniref:Uncharacterized protein n=1 Tax=Cardiocondyla obscurior TaxID=286306 RepID=A0AAW2EQE5_9HYME
MCVRIRTRRPGGCASSTSFRYPLREIIRERRTERTLVAITTSAIFFPCRTIGRLNGPSTSSALCRTRARSQRDVLIVRLDRYGRPCRFRVSETAAFFSNRGRGLAERVFLAVVHPRRRSNRWRS